VTRRIQLPDVNVLIALNDPAHEGHELAHRWFQDEGRYAWATCPLTENGFVRILSQPSYPNFVASPAIALSYLRDAIHDHQDSHHFWTDDVSLRDATLFDLRHVQGHRQLTDLYLLGLCQRRSGTLITLDTRVGTVAIVSPDPDLLRLLR
jgi:toxin-antitoxin system PIN domain toxin